MVEGFRASVSGFIVVLVSVERVSQEDWGVYTWGAHVSGKSEEEFARYCMRCRHVSSMSPITTKLPVLVCTRISFKSWVLLLYSRILISVVYMVRRSKKAQHSRADKLCQRVTNYVHPNPLNQSLQHF